MKYLKLLKKLASFSDHQDHKMSCIIVNKNKVISVGYNKMKTSPRSNTRYRTLHAELVALLSIPYEESRGCTAYIYRTLKTGELAISKPCEACQEALKLAGIKRVIYSDNNSWTEEWIA